MSNGKIASRHDIVKTFMSLINSIRRHFNFFINIGTNPEENEEKREHTLLRNKLALMLSLLTVPYVFIFYAIGSPFLSLVAFLITCTYFLSVLFNHLRWYIPSKLSIFLISDFTLLFYSIQLGRGADLDLAFLSFIALPWVLFKLDEKKYVWLCVGLSFLSFFISKTLQLVYDPQIGLSVFAMTSISYSISFASFIVAIATISFYSTTAQKLTISLKESILKLERANKEIEIKSKKAAQIEAVHELQKEFLPKIGKTISGFPQYKVDAFFKPSVNEICGDFYDVSRYQKQLRGIVGDVQGKGARAGFIAVHYLSFFQLQKNQNLTISEIASQINKKACHIRVPMNYCTTFLWDLNLETQELSYCHAGLEYAYIIRDRKLISLREGGIQFGIDESDIYGEGYIKLESNDILFVASDGISDKKNDQGERFGSQRLESLLTRYEPGSPFTIKKVVEDEVNDFCGNTAHADDITVFTISC